MNKYFMKNRESRYLSSFLKDGKCDNLTNMAVNSIQVRKLTLERKSFNFVNFDPPF